MCSLDGLRSALDHRLCTRATDTVAKLLVESIINLLGVRALSRGNPLSIGHQQVGSVFGLRSSELRC